MSRGRRRTQVDHLCREAVRLGELRRCGEALAERAAGGDDRDVGALAAHRGVRDVDGTRLLVDLGLERIEQRVLEDEHRIRLLERREEHAARILDRRRCERLDPGDVGVPGLETVLVLGGHLPAAPRCHAHDERNAHLPARHVAQGGGVVDHLVEREQAEVDRHHLDDRPHAAEGGTDPRTDEARLGERCVADALRAELVEEAEADGEGTAVAAHVLAHQEHPLIGGKRMAQSGAHGLAVGELDGAHAATTVPAGTV